MKKVLIIGYLPPRIEGSYRPVPLTRYLPEFGWEPVVLTASPSTKPYPELRVIETPHRDALAFWKKLLKYDSGKVVQEQVKERLGPAFIRPIVEPLIDSFIGLVNYPDYEKAWMPFALEAANELLEKEWIDAMISCRPITSYLVASQLKRRFNVPWVVDFTDPWSVKRDEWGYGSVNRLLYQRLEIKTLIGADALVANSEPWAEGLRKLHKNKSIYVITHGFDPADVKPAPAKLTQKFTITYTGMMYIGKQDPNKLFIALAELIKEGVVVSDDVEVRFFGRNLEWLDAEINHYGLSSVVKHFGMIPKSAALEKQRESQLLLLLDWEDPREKGMYTYKIFEYLGSHRPVLATGGKKDSIVAQLLEKTAAGVHAASVEEIKTALKQYYWEYKSRGAVGHHGLESEIRQYSQREMAGKFASILDGLVKKA